MQSPSGVGKEGSGNPNSRESCRWVLDSLLVMDGEISNLPSEPFIALAVGANSVLHSCI